MLGISNTSSPQPIIPIINHVNIGILISIKQELREDNSLLCECKDKLEEQVTSTQGRLNNVMHDLSKVQATMDAVDKVLIISLI